LIEIRNLVGQSWATLTEAFNDAFSDYDIPARYTVQYVEQLVTRRGYRPDLALGAFEGERLVGFVFNALDGDRAYNSGTGVVPSHRRQGIARELMQRSISIVPAREYVLEVIETNTRAIALYRSLGFDQRRRFQCWTYEASQREKITELANVDYDALLAWADVEPSWQNSSASLRRTIEPRCTLGNEDCAAVLVTSNGDVPLLVVRPEARRRGLGTRLLNACATRANRPLRIMNIDDRAAVVAAFLTAAGAKPFIAQLEMVRNLG
jgi:ribosomal protein S18 acetylase RimI-like enzyme